MAGQADLINFIIQFLPALIELDLRVSALEQGGVRQSPAAAAGADADGGESATPEADGEIDLGPLGKFNVGDMLKQAGGDPQSLFKRAAEWKAKQAAPPPQPQQQTASADGAANGKAT